MLIFHPQPWRSGPMVTYAEISKQYADYWSAREQHWNRLGDAAGQLVAEFEKSLALSATSWSSPDGTSYSYVDIGGVENGEFIRRPARGITRASDGTVDFAIRLTLEEGPRDGAKTFFIQNVRLAGGANSICVTLLCKDGPLEFKGAREGHGRFSDVVEAIKANVLRHLDPAQFG